MAKTRSRRRRDTMRVALLVAIAVGVWGYGWWRIVTAAPVTAAQPFRWRADDDMPRPGGFARASYIWNGDIVSFFAASSMDDSATASGWGLHDVTAGTVSLRWPLAQADEPDLAWLDQPEAVLPGPDGRLAFIVRRLTEVLVGIGDQSGWVAKPVSIGTSSEAVYLGAAWVDDHVEIALLDPFGHKASVVAVHPAASTPEPILDVRWADETCRFLGVDVGYRAGTPPRWTLADLDDAARTTCTVESTGTVHVNTPTTLPTDWQMLETCDVDGTAIGRRDLRARSHDHAALGADGRLLPRPPPPAPGWDDAVKVEQVVDLGPTAVTDRRVWLVDTGAARGQVIDGRAIATESVGGRLMIGEGDAPRHPVASGWYDDMAVLVPEPGGFLAVDPGHAMVHLTNDLRRRDPLSLRAHLRTLGSRDLTANARWPEAGLVWVLAALPILLLMAWGLARRPMASAAPAAPMAVVHNRRVRLRPFVIAALLYLAGALIVLPKLLPLLT